MQRSNSPLRYPGGKAKLYNYVRGIIESNNYIGCTYIEPFAGGAGLALKLLINDDVSKIVINDLDPAIYNFWFHLLNSTDEFVHKIKETDITISEREHQKSIYNDADSVGFDLGFSAFYLNRVNRSGIIKGGPIGGVKQSGKYKLNARFNKARLIEQIRNIAKYKDKIFVSNYDACDMLRNGYLKQFKKSFINFDPPYVAKGYQLYKNSFTEEDHTELRDAIQSTSRRWMVTYDVCELVERLYQDYRYEVLPINYSIGNTKKASEYAFFSNNLILPE